MSVLLGACGERQRILTVAESPWRDSLYPVETDNIASATIGAQIYETLFRAYPDGSIRFHLATGYEASPDGTVIRIRLRQGVRFHDGSPMDADAVVACLRFATARAVADSFYSKAAFYGFPASIDAEDDSTVVIRLPAPHNPLQRTLSALDHAAIARMTPATEGVLHVPPGTGPFRFRDVNEKDRTLRLEAFPNYWGHQPLADGIVVRAFEESEDAVAALRAGEIDIAYNATVGDDRPPVSTSDPVVVRGPRVGYSVLGLNNSRAPFSDRVSRYAFRQMVDVESLVQNSLKNLAHVIHQFVGPGLFPKLEEVELGRLSPEELDRTIREHFHALNRPLKYVRGPGSSPERDHWLAQALEAQLLQYGVELEYVIYSSWEDFDRAIEEGEWDISDDGSTTESHDLFEVLHLLYGFESSPGRYGFFMHDDARVPELLERARTELDPVASLALYQACLERITDLTPCIPLGEYGIHVLRSPGVLPFEWNGPHNLILSTLRKRGWE